jgi:hypothetical protein
MPHSVRSLFHFSQSALGLICPLIGLLWRRAEEGAEQGAILGAAQAVCARYGINHATIQIDPHDLPECLQSTHE